jgi:quercetin dioxygenase-like cupin family protein
MNEHRAGNTAVSITVLGLVLFFTSCAANQDASPAGLFHLETAQWSEPYDGPLGFPKGAQRASLGTDPASGGETYYAKFPAGSRFQLHWHAHAEYAVVLRGKVTHLLGSERQPLNVGDYVIIPPKQPHGWEADANEDAFLLIRRDGPADFNFVK